MRYVYPARLSEHPGTVIVAFRDLEEAVTEGPNHATALIEAVDCLDSALLFRLKEGSEIPPPSDPEPGEIVVSASPSVAAKAAFIRAFRAGSLTRVGLAGRLGVQENEVRRMLDPEHATKLDRLDAGLRALGRRLVVADEAA